MLINIIFFKLFPCTSFKENHGTKINQRKSRGFEIVIFIVVVNSLLLSGSGDFASSLENLV